MDEKAYQILFGMSEPEWKRTILRLGRYASSVSSNLGWRTGNSLDLPDGETVDSIVSKAIQKLFSGERNWNPEADPSLEKYLMDVVDSLLNHLAESEDNKRLTFIAERADDLSASEETKLSPCSIGPEWLIHPAQSPEAKLLARDQAQRDDQTLDALIAECADDPVLSKVLEAMFDGYDDPRSIAERIGITRTDVYNANKRLDRKICSLRARLTPKKTLRVAKGKRNA